MKTPAQELLELFLEREKQRNFYLKEAMKYNPHKIPLDLYETRGYWNNRILATIL